ncbi:MAG: ParA family protein [Oscillospiraceae bacterium]|nr:ParA family protein [Oscillospiraceae bacterium]
MGKVIAIVNQKGGVGKTTTCVNTAAALKEAGKRVLMVDFDPQGNATSGFGVDKQTSPNIYDVIIGRADIRNAVYGTPYADIVPSNKQLSGAEPELLAERDRELRLRGALAPIKGNYDYIMVDSPPTLTLLTVQCLCAADSVLIPVQCEYYALEGLSDLMFTLRAVRKSLNPPLDIEGILLTMYDARVNLTFQVTEEVKRHFPGQVYACVIPRSVRLSEAPSHGRPIQHYDRYSKAAESYNALAAEILRKNSK